MSLLTHSICIIFTGAKMKGFSYKWKQICKEFCSTLRTRKHQKVTDVIFYFWLSFTQEHGLRAGTQQFWILLVIYREALSKSHNLYVIYICIFCKMGHWTRNSNFSSFSCLEAPGSQAP